MVMMGGTAVAQADEIPPAGTITYIGTLSAPSPKDILMIWGGTCTNPGQELRFGVNSEIAGVSETSLVKCQSDGTYQTGFMVYDYADRGLEYGQSFDYSGWLVSEKEPFVLSEVSGTATLRPPPMG
jgi:hypothetical protein